MKTICLFDTAIGTSNVGDEIIWQSAVKGLEPVTRDAFVLRLGTHVANFDLPQMMKPNRKIRFFSDGMDHKFICGTSLVTDRMKGRHLQWMVRPYHKALYKGAVLVGAGKNRAYDNLDRYASKLYQSILSHDYKHSVRDEQTAEVLEKLGFETIVTGCPTVWLLTKELCARIPQGKAGRAVISLSGQKKYHAPKEDQYLIDTALKLYDEVYVWIQTTEDEPYVSSMRGQEKLKRICSLACYDELLSEGDIDYVGTRLHGGIYALQHAVRTIIISIDQRAEGIRRANHIPVLKREEIDGLEEKILQPFQTEIVVDRERIDGFLGQFL